MFVQKSPFPLFEKGEKKVSLCKGRFRGIFDLLNTALTGPVQS